MFLNQPPEKLLRALGKRNIRANIYSPVNTIDESCYICRVYERGVKCSMDQLKIDIENIRGYYFEEPDENCNLFFSKASSVLNILLHFSKDKLVNDDESLFCRYRYLDEWHKVTSELGEDIFTTSYLAAFDLNEQGERRTIFAWPPYLGVETNDINSIFEREISDLHAHLKGSSLNFELSWMSLMNFPCHREKDFLNLYGKSKFRNEDNGDIDCEHLYKYFAVAVALRLYLFERVINGQFAKVEEYVQDLAQSESLEEVQNTLNKLSVLILYCRSEYGKRYSNLGLRRNCPDYAINEERNEIFTVLSGERRILYYAFRDAFNGDEKVALYLYAYIILKQQLREKIVQLNNIVGFANFEIYEKRKSCFIPDGSVYEKILYPLAFLAFLRKDHPRRYMEGRLVPKDSITGDSVTIRNIDNDVRKWLQTAEDENYPDEDCRSSIFRGYYIFHFIKGDDKQLSDLYPRHCHLRHVVKRQAIALYDYRRKGYKSASRVVGIDAANSEIKCRPEVFAHAFRFLRRHYIEEGVENHPASLGFTYHVGEDFYDIVDGLRSVDEVLTYMNFRSNDRLGHALVLGTDVKQYYDGRGKTIHATKQVLLDNYVWLYVQVTKIAGNIALCGYLEREARHLYNQIYQDIRQDIQFDINDYYESWLLRGDAPETAGVSKRSEPISDWGKSALNEARKDVNRARGNSIARNLYYEYHFNQKAKENGSKAIICTVPHNFYEEFVIMTDKVREKLLEKVERLHIAIECNPSSNLRIGEMTSYIEHPIFKFYNYGLNTPYPPHEISVSINTDDSGVFSTSLEREYTLLGIALEKSEDPNFKNSPRAILEWLNRVRKMSVEQRFCKTE